MKKSTIAFFQNIVESVFYFLTKVLLRPRVTGKMNLADLLELMEISDLGAVIVSNHINALDPFFIFSQVPFKIRKKIFPIIFLGKAELFNRKFKKVVMDALGVIPVKEGSAVNINIRSAIKRIKNGGIIFLFPEGHVSLDGSFSKSSRTINVFSHCTPFILQPIRISGIGRWRRDWKDILLLRKRLEIHFGEPFVIEKNSKVDAVEIIKGIK